MEFVKTEKQYIIPDMLLHGNIDDELVAGVNSCSDDTYTIFNNGCIVGYCSCISGKSAYLYVYIFPQYRGIGIGKKAISYYENKLITEHSEVINCRCEYGVEQYNDILHKLGYGLSFAVNRKEYGEAPSPYADDEHIRQYKDEDYTEAHRMYAEAFHLMRISTVWFKNSKPEPESDKMKDYWARTASERLVYECDGEIIGYAHIKGNEIGSVSIKPEKQGNGYGRRFVGGIIHRILSSGYKTVILDCVIGNDKACSLYNSMGFYTTYFCAYYRKSLL